MRGARLQTHGTARGPTIVTTCEPMTSRSLLAMSRKKSAMQRPPSLFWRGKIAREG
jgi:hypothetical protein